MTATRQRSSTERCAPAYDLARVRADFPILAQRGQRPAPGLPRQRRHHPEAAGGDRRRSTDCYEEYYANVHRGVHTLSPARDRGLRAGARDRPPVPERAERRGDRLRARHHRGDQPGGRELGPAERRPGRRDPDHRPGAPLEHRPLAAAVRGARRAPAGGAARRPRRGAARRVRAPALPAHPHRRLRPRLERPRHGQPGARDGRAGPRAPAPPCWSTARRRRPTCRWTSRRWAATSTPSPATRSTARAASACSGAGPSCSPPCRPGRAAAA